MNNSIYFGCMIEDNRWTSYILTMADSKHMLNECECLFVDSKNCYHQVPITSRAGRICWKCGMSHDIDTDFIINPDPKKLLSS